MIIQLGHSRDSDFQRELYIPLKNSSFFSEHTWIFPHDCIEVESRTSLKTIDLFIAEVSHPATGLGIEIGLASTYGKRILCISKKGSKIANSLKYVTDDFLEYEDAEDMIEKIRDYLYLARKNEKKKVYVGCALTHAPPEFRAKIGDFKKRLGETFDILDFMWVTGGEYAKPADVYLHDRGCVLDADILIAECSYPSTGLGYEIATAVEYGKKILLIAHKDAVVTRMILGIPPEQATILRYETLDEVHTFIEQYFA